MGYSGLLWVIPGYYGVLSYRLMVSIREECGPNVIKSTLFKK